MVAFMVAFGKRANKPLLRILYHNPIEDFDSALARTKDYMLVDEALDSLEGEDQKLSKKSQKMEKKEELSHKRIPARRQSPPPPR